MGYVKVIDCTGREIERRPLPRRWQSLQSVYQRHAPKTRAVILSRHRRGEVLLPTDDSVVRRADWSRTIVRPGDIIVITRLPRGGGAGSSSGVQIGAMIGLLALTVALPFALPLIAPAIFAAGSFLTIATSAGIVLGASYAVGKMTAPSSATSADDKPQYGVSGGGNLPRPGDRIPKRYGQNWAPPDLSQKDWFRYDGDDMVLFKRVTVGLGPYRIDEIKVAGIAFWNSTDGVLPPFNAAPGGNNAGQAGAGYGGGLSASDTGGSEIEILQPGDTSTLVPSTVFTQDAVSGQTLARPGDIPNITGPFPVTPQGETTTRIQLDFSLPQGVSGVNNTPGGWGVKFQIATCDEDDNATSGFTDLLVEGGTLHSTRAVRMTRDVDVANGRYLVTGQNTMLDFANTQSEATWDGLRGHSFDTVVRPHVTEIAMRVRSGKNLGVTAFGDVKVRTTAILPVWTGSAWELQPTRKAVYAWLDVFRADYGAALADSEVDLDIVKFYASELTENDTFDGIIRGPVSIWDAANTALGPIRAETTRIGNVWSLHRDEAQSQRRHHITRRQVVRDSTGSDFAIARDDGLADVICEYNPDGDPDRRREVRVTFGGQSRTPQRVNLIGVSDYAHAQEYATWRASSAYFRRETRRVTVDRRGRLFRRGEIALIDSWFMTDGTQAAGILAYDSGTRTLALDTDIDLSTTKYLAMRDRKGLVWGPVQLSAGSAANIVVMDAGDLAAAQTAAGTSFADAMLTDLEEMTSVNIGPIAEIQQQYIISKVEPQGRDSVQISALNDAPEVWTALGESVPPQPPIPSQGDILDTDAADISWVRARCVQKALNLVAEWSTRASHNASAIIVKLSYDDGTSWEEVSSDLSTNGSYVLRHEEGITVKMAAWAINRAGIVGEPKYTTFVTFKPAVNSDTSDLFVDAEALADEINATLAQVQPVVDAAAKLLVDTTRIVQALNPIKPEGVAPTELAAIAALVPDDIFTRSDVALRAAMLALQKAKTLQDGLAQAGFGTHDADGRYSIEGVGVIRQGLVDLQAAVSITADLTNATLALKASTSYVNDVAAGIIQGSIPAYRWEFNGTLEGWTAVGCTVTQNAGTVTLLATAPVSYLQSPALTLDADANKVVNVEIRRLAGTDWGVALNYGPAYSIQRSMAVPTSPSSWSLAGLDQRTDATWTGTLTGVQIVFGGTIGDSVEIDFIELGSFRLQDLLLSDAYARLASAEILIDGLTGAITEKANTTTVANLQAIVNDVSLLLDATVDEIALSASQTAVDDLNTRVSSAEVQISGALSQISLVTETSGLLQSEIALQASLNALAQAWKLKDKHLVLIARAESAMRTYVDELGGFVAVKTDTLQSQVGDNRAELVAEISTRASADSAEATSRLLLAAVVNDPVTGLPGAFSSLTSESSARASADTAEAALRVVLASQVNDPTTGLPATRASALQEITDRVTAVSAEATARLALAAVVNDPTTGLAATAASVVTEASARASAVSAEAATRAALAAVVNDPTTGLAATAASVVTEASARASADSSEAATRAALAAVVNDPTTGLAATAASVSTEASARASGDSANASSITALAAVVNDPTTGLAAATASVVTEASARASGDSANASSITAVSTTVGGHTASIGTLLDSGSGSTVRGGIVGTINGVTGGLILTGVEKADKSVSYAVEIGGSLVVDGTITGAKLDAASARIAILTAGVITASMMTVNSIQIQHIVNASITSNGQNSNGGPNAIGSTSDFTALTASVTFTGVAGVSVPIQVTGSFDYNSGSSGSPSLMAWRVDANGGIGTVDNGIAATDSSFDQRIPIATNCSIIATGSSQTVTFSLIVNHQLGSVAGNIVRRRLNLVAYLR